MQTQRQAKYIQIICRHERLIERLCIRHSHGDAFLCAEFKQSCHIAIWTHLPSLRPDTDGKNETLWVIWQCRSVFSHEASSKKRIVFETLNETMDSPESNEQESMLETLDEMAQLLPSNMQSPFLLMAAGLSVPEIAQQLGIKNKSVLQLRYRIISLLRKHFAKNGGRKNKTETEKNGQNE